MRATGAPSCCESAATSTVPPRPLRSSAIFSTISVGRPRSRIGAASSRWRPRLVESRISKTPSGRGTPGRDPLSTSCVICSSSDRAARLYKPGRSMSSASLPLSSLTRPECCSTVTPGKLATFWRSPVSRLKSVDLPELGGPMIAITACAGPLDNAGNTEVASPHPWQSLMQHPGRHAISAVTLFRGATRIPIHPPDRRVGRHPEPSGPPSHLRQAEIPVPSAATPDRRADPGGR